MEKPRVSGAVVCLEHRGKKIADCLRGKFIRLALKRRLYHLHQEAPRQLRNDPGGGFNARSIAIEHQIRPIEILAEQVRLSVR